MQPNIRFRGEDGSIAVTAMVSFIALAVTAAMLTTVFRDIRVSRRAGDSANALQVADAGINDAVKSLRDAVAVAGGCPWAPSTTMAFSRTSTLAGGEYTFCAFPDTDVSGRAIWHIDATATDATGVKRRLRADAAAVPLYPNAINVLASGSFSSGFSVDSFKDEVNRCTKKGYVGTNSPNTFTFGNSGNNSSENCQNNPNGTFPYPPDGCVAYSRDGSATIRPSQIGPGQCPPAHTTTASPQYIAPSVGRPETWDLPAGGAQGDNFTCNSATLQAGKTYFYSSVTLAENCGFPTGGPYPTMATPTKIYTNSLTLAGGQGSSSLNPINLPPNSATVCGPTHGLSGANPLYCPGWAGGLQIFVNAGPVTFSGNHSTFWGVITAPSSTVTWSGGGGSQWEIFGSLVARSVSGAVQAKWHYDESLGALTSGRFTPQNWREEPLQ
ncbi:MAG: hypothetical protein KY443_02990 [Actinobacteria bacterium]|nr:hypothetical protein [Actinomycetota bacterium]